MSYLNISGCTALEYLSCSSNGDNLTNIVGLKDCKNLTNFDGFYNDFKQLDFSGNPELTSIYLAGNIHLESLDITKCIKLNWMSLWDSRSLHSIDLSHNTQLEELWAYHLSNADLGDNQSITSLNVWAPASGFQFSELPHLTYLGVWNCHNLDLSGNPAIEGLYIGEGCTGTINIANLSELNSLNVCNGSLVESIDISNNLKITHYNSAPCSTLKTLIVSSEQVIAGVTENRSEEFIHPNTEIVIKQ